MLLPLNSSAAVVRLSDVEEYMLAELFEYPDQSLVLGLTVACITFGALGATLGIAKAIAVALDYQLLTSFYSAYQ